MRRRPDRIIVGEVRGGELVEQEHHRQFGLRLVVGDASERDAGAAARKARIRLIRRARPQGRSKQSQARERLKVAPRAYFAPFLRKGEVLLAAAAPVHRVTEPPS